MNTLCYTAASHQPSILHTVEYQTYFLKGHLQGRGVDKLSWGKFKKEACFEKDDSGPPTTHPLYSSFYNLEVLYAEVLMGNTSRVGVAASGPRADLGLGLRTPGAAVMGMAGPLSGEMR